MKTVVVRYRVKPDRANENVQLVEAVFTELKQTAPRGVHYAAFVEEDGLSFVHIASFDDEIENPMPQMDSFKAFQKDIKDRCDEAPLPEQLSEIGCYNFFS